MDKRLLRKLKKITLRNINSPLSPYFRGAIKDIIKYALTRNIEVYQIFDGKNLFILKGKGKIFWFFDTLTSAVNSVGEKITRNKHNTKEFLKKLGYPVPEGIVIKSLKQLEILKKNLVFPVVVKPLGSGEGKGVTTGIKSKSSLISAFRAAVKYDKRVLIENHLPGDYYRITFIANGAYAATKNMPAFIRGDGKSTAAELISLKNREKERSERGRLNKIRLNEKVLHFLASAGFKITSIIPSGEEIPLCFSGADGGEYIDVTEIIHPSFIKMAREIVAILGLPIVGIDIVTVDITKPLTKKTGGIIEINGSYPIMGFHSRPTIGKPRYLAPELVNYLFNLK